MTNQAGNAFWSAPEVIQGRHYDLSADIFSLGIVLVELLTHFDPSDLDQVPRKKDMGVDVDSVVFPADSPADLIPLIRSCLSVIPTERPTSASVVNKLSEVKDLLHSQLRDKSHTPIERHSKKSSKNQ